MSAPRLEDVKKLDQRTQDCVYGYIRSVQKVLPDDNTYYIIPTLVIHFCLLYLSSIERFAVFDSDLFKMEGDNKIITSLKREYGAAFLREIVDSGIHRWEFKILKYTDRFCTMHIGVWKSRYLPVTNSLISHKGKGYNYLISHGALSYGDEKDSWGSDDRFVAVNKWRCKAGDIVEMILDLNVLELRYITPSTDGKEVVAFNKIENTSYRAAVAMYNDVDSIELLSYSRY